MLGLALKEIWFTVFCNFTLPLPSPSLAAVSLFFQTLKEPKTAGQETYLSAYWQGRIFFLIMGILDLLLQSPTVSLLGTLVVLLLVYLVSSSSFSFQQDKKEPPGPKPLPVLGNLLQLDLKRLHNELLKVRKLLANFIGKDCNSLLSHRRHHVITIDG